MTANETSPTHTEQAIRHLVPEVDRWGDVRTPSRHQGHSDYVLSALTTDALIGSGHALLAIREELAGIRAELGCRADDLNEIAAAIRELTGALWNLGIASAISEVGEEVHKLRPVPFACGCVWRGDIRVKACRDHKEGTFFARLCRRWFSRRSEDAR
ncbi:hypothetical protein [Microbispora rosea]|uniref:hypothetical protein n=1 Tax=Microbispora rosea TaxID=58117 RepID=UPI00379B12D1